MDDQNDTKARLKTWIEHLRKVDMVEDTKKANEQRQQEEDEFNRHLKEIEMAEQKLREKEEKKRKLLKTHLAKVLKKQKETDTYNKLTLMQRRIYRALLQWYKEQDETVPDGLLELHFRRNSLIKTHFEKIEDDIDSTLKIKKMKGSDKLKEMLLVFRRGKNILLEFYNKDLRENIYTFMFMDTKIQANDKSPEVMEVIKNFRKFQLKQ